MRFMLGVLKVFVVFLTVALASPNVHATNDRTLTPVIKTEPRTGGVQVTPRDLFTRQSCETGYEECHDHCCSTFDTCCENSCTPLGGECCSDGLSCDSGEACCGDKCMPSLASCCGGGEGYCTLSMGSCTEEDGEWMCERYGGSDQGNVLGAPAWQAVGGLVAVGVGAIGVL